MATTYSLVVRLYGLSGADSVINIPGFGDQSAAQAALTSLKSGLASNNMSAWGTVVGPMDSGGSGTTVTVDNFPTTQPVSGSVSVSNLPATQPVSGTVSVGNFPATQPVSGTVSVSNFPATQPVSGTITANAGSGTFAVSAASLPLPTGAALDATLTGGTQKSKLVDSGGTNVATVSAGGALKVDGSAATQPVSGTFWQATQPVSGTFWQATQPVSGTVTANIGTAGTLALDATLTGGTQKTKLVDSGGTNVATISAGGALKVDGSATTQPVSGTFWQATQPVSGTFWQATQPVSGTVTANIGTSGSLALDNSLTGGSQKSQIVDAGARIATIKAASTPSVAGDTSLVVALNPGSPMPAGTKATYIASVQGQANTAASHAIALEASASKTIRLRKVIITQPGSQTTAGVRILLLERTTAAGTAGLVSADSTNATTASQTKLDPSDGGFGGAVRAKPTSLGTQGATIMQIPIFVPAALAAFTPIVLDLENLFGKPIIVAAGSTNGIALRDPGATGAANFGATFVFTEE